MTRIRRLPLAILGLAFLALPALSAQTMHGNNFAIDYHLGQTGGDFNTGLGLKSPTFLELLNLEAAGDVVWHESVAPGAPISDPVNYFAYGTVKLGLNLEADAMQGIGRLYTGAGGVLILPGVLSVNPAEFGIYGIFGFDFWILPDQSWSYFVELGGTFSIDAYADRIVGAPSLQNGFSVNTGFRIHL